MAEKYTNLDLVIAAVVAGNPKQKVKSIEFGSYGYHVARVEWYENDEDESSEQNQDRDREARDPATTPKMSTRELDLLRDAVDIAIEQENTGVESWDQAQSIESQRRQAQLMEIQKKLR